MIRSFAYVRSAQSYIVEAGKKISYPICIVEHNAGNISSTQHFSTHNTRVYLLDLVNRANNADANEQDVLSDMHGVALDLIALFRDPAYFDTWFIEGNANVTMITDSTADYCAGVGFDLPINTFFLGDRCAVPANALPADTIEIINTGRDWTWVQFEMQNDSNTFSLSSLIGKTILGIWREDMPQSVVVSNPSDQREYLFNDVTGTITFSAANILFSGEIITIICK
jgi:hypothetical protein